MRPADPLVRQQPAHRHQVGAVQAGPGGLDLGQVDPVRGDGDGDAAAQDAGQPLGGLR